MRVSRMMGACVLAMALSAAFAAGASASLPELGRCILVPRGTGAFIGKNCVHPSPTNKGEAKFEAGAVKNKFEGETPVGAVTLETKKLKVVCTAATLNG
jgi:hypothetical protein